MLLKYLQKSDHVGWIIQFDAPVHIGRLRLDDRPDGDSGNPFAKEIADTAARRFLQIDDEPVLIRPTFVYANERGLSFLGRSLPRSEDYRDYVATAITENCIGNLVSWA